MRGKCLGQAVGGLAEGQPVIGGPKVERVALGLAIPMEATEDALCQVDREGAVVVVGGIVQGARPTAPCRKTTPKRAALWAFERLDMFRSTLLHRAGRLTWPQGRLTLTVSASAWLKARFLHLLNALHQAA